MVGQTSPPFSVQLLDQNIVLSQLRRKTIGFKLRVVAGQK